MESESTTSKRKTTKKSSSKKQRPKKSSSAQGDPDGLEGRDVVESSLALVNNGGGASKDETSGAAPPGTTSLRKSKRTKKTKKGNKQQQQHATENNVLPPSTSSSSGPLRPSLTVDIPSPSLINSHQQQQMMETIMEQHPQQHQPPQQTQSSTSFQFELQPLPEHLKSKPSTVSTSRNTSTSTSTSSVTFNLPPPKHHQQQQFQNGTSETDEEENDGSSDNDYKEHFYRSTTSNVPSSNPTSSTPNVVIVDTQERQLFTDTFSFLMTARYPCEQETKKVLNHIENKAIHIINEIDDHGRKAIEGGKHLIENTRTTIANNKPNILLRPYTTAQQQQNQYQHQQSDHSLITSSHQSASVEPQTIYSIQGGQLYSTRKSVISTTATPSSLNMGHEVSGSLFYDTSHSLRGSDYDENNGDEIFDDELLVVSTKSRDKSIDESEIFTISTPQLSENAKKLLKVNADYMYLPFICGWMILLLQVFIYFVVFMNVLRTEGEPPNADAWLRCAQWFALMVSLYTQGDLVDAIFLLTEGSYRFESITTPFKFNLSNAMRFGSGNLGLMASFVLVIYAADIVDLLLNFTAIEFVSLLDNHAFHLASKGFLGINIEKKAKQIEQFRYEQLVRKSSSMKRLCVYILYFLIFSGVFLYLTVLQKSRKIGVENQIYVQFDDTNVPELFGVSGAYIGCPNYRTFRNGQTYTNDIGYVDASWHNKCPELVQDIGNPDGEWIYPPNAFYFCAEEEGWVYIKKETNTPCDESGYLLRSFSENPLPADFFDILKHSEADWFVQQQETQALVLVDSVFMSSVNPRNLFGIQYNCTTGLQPILNIEPWGTTRQSFASLPYSYYPIFEADFENLEEDVNYFDKFSLVYRQVFFGDTSQNDGTIIDDTVTIPDCNNPESFEDEWNLVMFDGLHWHAMRDFKLWTFVEHFKSKYSDAADEPDNMCGWLFFLRYYLRDFSWMFNDEIVTPYFISEPMLFLKPVDTGGPTIDLEWFEDDIIYSEEIFKPGRSTFETGVDLEVSCLIQEAQCAKNEIIFNVEVKTQRFPEETAVVILRQPSLQGIAIEDYFEVQELLGDRVDLYAAAEIIPTAKESSIFSIAESEVKDFRFRDRETSYHLETCVPAVEGFTFCMDVAILNRNPSREGSRLADFSLGFGDNARRSFEVDTSSSNCTRYQVCYFEPDYDWLEDGVFLGDFFGPEDCSYAEIEAEYPGIASQVAFEDASTRT